MPSMLQSLAASNITAVLDELQDIRQIPQPFVWYGRIPSVFAEDGEILARYTQRVLAAEIIPNDQAAVVRQSNPVRTQQTNIPNIKHGELITQSMLTILHRIESELASRREVNVFEDYIARRAVDIRNGVIARIELMLCAMLVDDLDYDALGVKITNGTWGMPSDLKVTAGTAWSDVANATPVTDIQTINQLAAEKYGFNYNRLTMPRATFTEMVSTTQFKNMAQLYSSIAFPAATFPVQDMNLMTGLAGRILNMDIELYDAQTFLDTTNGSGPVASRYLPLEKVIFSSTMADNNANMWDFANGVVIETQPGRVPNLIGDFGGEREGPVAYATGADPNGNPPGVILWGVARGFPRKHELAVNAVLST